MPKCKIVKRVYSKLLVNRSSRQCQPRTDHKIKWFGYEHCYLLRRYFVFSALVANRYERFCSFCKPSIGNEFHYLMKCKHSSFSLLRSAFLERLYKINSNFINMTDKALFIYILTMHDENVVNLSAQYIDNIQNCYKSMKDDESFSSSNVNI